MLDDQEETGWKYIHGDVFRFPPYRSLFCAFVGTGFQVGPLSAISVLICSRVCISWRVLNPEVCLQLMS